MTYYASFLQLSGSVVEFTVILHSELHWRPDGHEVRATTLNLRSSIRVDVAALFATAPSDVIVRSFSSSCSRNVGGAGCATPLAWQLPRPIQQSAVVWDPKHYLAADGPAVRRYVLSLQFMRLTLISAC